MKMKHLKAGLEYALNYHGIDARLSTPDHALADAIYLQVAHGVACSKRGLDPAMTPYDQLSLDEMAETLRPVKTEQDIAALAERLAKVEDRLAGKQIDEFAIKRELNQRIDKVAEIVGERIGGLVDRIAALENGDAQDYDYVLKGLDEVRLRAGLGTMQAEHPRGGPVFPTGGADTAEAAAEAVLPVPQRGDRVLLKAGTQTLGGAVLKEQWATVIGVSVSDMVQVELDGQGDTRSIPWIDRSFIKEVKRHADNT